MARLQSPYRILTVQTSLEEVISLGDDSLVSEAWEEWRARDLLAWLEELTPISSRCQWRSSPQMPMGMGRSLKWTRRGNPSPIGHSIALGGSTVGCRRAETVSGTCSEPCVSKGKEQHLALLPCLRPEGGRAAETATHPDCSAVSWSPRIAPLKLLFLARSYALRIRALLRSLCKWLACFANWLRCQRSPVS